MPTTPGRRIVVGTMTGTSIDGLDVAVTSVTGHGLDLSVELLGHVQVPLGVLAADLRALAEQAPLSAGTIARLANDFGTLHATTIHALVASCSVTPDLIAVHGQTVHHAPPLSWALIDPAPILSEFDCDLVSGLRINDLAEGGQGAPITPLADWILFRSDRPRAVVNLGGFCNISHLPAAADGPARLRGRDVCACNHPLDAEARRSMGLPMDRDGAVALAGTADDTLAARLSAGLTHQPNTHPKALGTGEEMYEMLDCLEQLERPEDRLATLVDAIARTISNALDADQEILFFGGGIRNQALQAALRRHLNCQAIQTESLGIQPEAREPAAMAVLGALAADNVPITVAAVTGRRTRPRHRDGAWHLAIRNDFTDPLQDPNREPRSGDR
jgi:anhydro-N-acetylmuramic acid kinase